MTGKRGVIGGVGGVVAAAVLGGAALALAGGDGGKTPVGAGKEPVGGSGTTTTTEAGPDPLCVAHDVLAGTVAGLGTIDGPGDLEVFVTAQLTFHTAAAGREAPPDGDAFASMAAYYATQRDFFAARGWQQRVDITEAALVPRPPTDGSVARTAEILADRCGVSVGPDTPA
jgi:hypothetical protein